MTEVIDWWFSGRNWYCTLKRWKKPDLVGCGPTQERAEADVSKQRGLSDGASVEKEKQP